MKSPRQQRNEARRARHRAAEATAQFESTQDVARRTKDASDAARLSRLEVQGRGYRPVFAQAPVVVGAAVAPPEASEAVIGGGVEEFDSRGKRVGGMVRESGGSRAIGGGTL